MTARSGAMMACVARWRARGLCGALILLAVAACAPSDQDDATAAEQQPRPGGAGARTAQAHMDDELLREMLSGSSTAPASSAPQAWRTLRADVERGDIVLDEAGVPRNLDTRQRKPSDSGQFIVQLEPPPDGVAMNDINRYEVRVLSADGAPVSGATLAFVGGMPLHGHGFPTAPAFGPETAPGVYPLDGVRFGMAGWWQLLLSISADGNTDTVTFDLVVNP